MSVASYVALRIAVQAVLVTVPGIGSVYPYIRNIGDDAVLRELGVTNGGIGPVNLCMHMCEGYDQSYLTDMEKVKRHRWHIQVLYTVQDAVQSELAFQAIMHGIGDAFDRNYGRRGAGGRIPAGQLRNRLHRGLRPARPQDQGQCQGDRPSHTWKVRSPGFGACQVEVKSL